MDQETYHGIEDKTRTWTANDWREMRELLKYRGRIKKVILRDLDDLKTDQMYDILKTVTEMYNQNIY